MMIFRFILKSLKNLKIFKYDFEKCDNSLRHNCWKNGWFPAFFGLLPCQPHTFLLYKGLLQGSFGRIINPSFTSHLIIIFQQVMSSICRAYRLSRYYPSFQKGLIIVSIEIRYHGNGKSVSARHLRMRIQQSNIIITS